MNPMDTSGFVTLADVVPDILQDIRYYSAYNFTGRRVEAYEQPVALLSRRAAEALIPVAEDVARLGREEEMAPALAKRPRQDDLWGLSPILWGLSPEGGVEIGDVAT